VSEAAACAAVTEREGGAPVNLVDPLWLSLHEKGTVVT
jgi:hypothetical protein